MAMTKRDFEALAKALNEATDLEDARLKIADVCEDANTYFDKVRFVRAAGGDWSKVEA